MLSHKALMSYEKPAPYNQVITRQLTINLIASTAFQHSPQGNKLAKLVSPAKRNVIWGCYNNFLKYFNFLKEHQCLL